MSSLFHDSEYPVAKRRAIKPVPSNNRRANTLRIIAGQWRGRKLPFGDHEGLRPTGDRVRETLFNWLQLDIIGARCVDLFAGAGALGFEAASRGAKHVTMIEKSIAVANQLRQNEALLNSHNTQVIHSDALHWLDINTVDCDILFLDPPFANDLLQQSIDRLKTKPLKPHCLIYIESAKGSCFTTPAHWQLLKDKSSGQINYALYQLVNNVVSH